MNVELINGDCLEEMKKIPDSSIDMILCDLSARLPYGVKIKIIHKGDRDKGMILRFPPFDVNKISILIEPKPDISIRPYLFPMSSMTDEQKKYITDRWGVHENFNLEIDPNRENYSVDLCDVVEDYTNWLNENHFDYRGLIEKGLAIDATRLNIY